MDFSKMALFERYDIICLLYDTFCHQNIHVSVFFFFFYNTRNDHIR